MTDSLPWPAPKLSILRHSTGSSPGIHRTASSPALTNHVQAKLEPLAQALAAALDPLALINPVEAGRVPPRDVDRDFGPSH